MSDERVKLLALTKDEIEMIFDCVKVTTPQTRTLALKVAGLVLEWAADDSLRQAASCLDQAPAVPTTPKPC